MDYHVHKAEPHCTGIPVKLSDELAMNAGKVSAKGHKQLGIRLTSALAA